MAYIERIEVENEGFLAGVNVEFKPGLNVVIGARGTGKTSLIELIRYGLSAGSFTTDAGRKGELQSIAVLDGGAVTITIRDAETRWAVTRTSDGITSTTLREPPGCTVLAQNEIESIGVSPQGRRALIDRFLTNPAEDDARISLAGDALRSLTTDVSTIISEATTADSALEELRPIEGALADARAVQGALLASSSASIGDQNALTDTQQRLNSLANQESQLVYATSALREVQAETAAIRTRIADIGAGVSTALPASGSLSSVRDAAASLSQASENFARALQALAAETAQTMHARAQLDDESRALRQRLDSAQTGLSQASRRVQQLEERKGQLDAVTVRRADLLSRLNTLRSRRLEAYREFASQLMARLEARQSVATALSGVLGPRIRVRVSAGQRVDSYTSALVAGMRGSGLHYNNLAPMLASTVSPFELVDWAERGAVSDLARATGLSAERSAAVIAAIRESGGAEIISSTVEDEVTLELLDGSDYKPVEHLSIGQRCTVVLPILLALRGETLVVDQPEDHLDNAYITSTLISAIAAREGFAQTILTSHNANIPVLGEAAHVIVMESDGESGQVAGSGGLELPKIVASISEIMEGGAAAFAARANFYSRTSTDE